MGCWNYTCGISNLFIEADDLVMAFVLLRIPTIPTVSDWCYPTTLYSPILFPFYTTYTGYGTGENSKGAGLTISMSAICKYLYPTTLSNGSVIDKDTFGESEFWDAVRLRELYVTDAVGVRYQVDVSMIRADVLSDILYHYRVYQYSRQRGTYQLLRVSYQEMIDALPAVITAMQQLHPSASLYTLSVPNNIAWNQLTTSISEFSRLPIFTLREVIDTYRTTKEWDMLLEVLKSYFIGIVINACMDDTRRIWCPQSGQGSQSSDIIPHEILNRIVARVLADIENRDRNDS